MGFSESLFSPQTLAEVLFEHLRLDLASHFFVSYSGGMDSTVLLHTCRALNESGVIQNLTALHSNHGIHSESNIWEQQCKVICEQMGVEFEATRLYLGRDGDRVSEATARKARYEWLRQFMNKNSILMTAHHQSDQVETLLLNLLRGAGVRGLSGIQPVTEFGEGKLVRPLLEVTKDQIREYLHKFKLSYVEDPANHDLQYSRSYLRSVVIPALEQHWPVATNSIARTVHLLQDTRGALDELVRHDFDFCKVSRECYFSHPIQLKIKNLRQLSRFRQVNLIRFWINTNDLPEPNQSMLDDFIQSVVQSDSKAGAMKWSGHQVLKYQNALYLVRSLSQSDNGGEYEWDLNSPLAISEVGIKICPTEVVGAGIDRSKVPGSISVRFRSGGERIKLPGREHSSKIKKILQESSIPTWERKMLPLIYSGEELVAMAPNIVASKYAATSDRRGVVLRLEQLDNS